MAETDRAAFELDQVVLTAVDEEGQPLKLLRQVTGLIARGRLTALIGPSGGGKTSLLRLLNRLDAPDSGTARLDGRDLGQFDSRDLRRRVGFVPQHPFCFEESARSNLLKGLTYLADRSITIPEDRLHEICRICHFPVDLLNRDARRLSVGQQQRLALGRALVLDPEVLLLDEPTSALDRPTADALGRSFRQLCTGGMTIVLVTHDLEWAKAYADELLFVAGGRVLVQKDAADFFDHPGDELAEAFLAGELSREVDDE